MKFKHALCCFSVALCVFCACLTVVLPVPAAKAATGSDMQGGVVLVLPFYVHGAEDERLESELAILIGQRLRAKGLMVVPFEEGVAHLEKSGIKELTLTSVRTLMRNSGATSAIYGNYIQAGDSFTLDSRLVMLNPAEGSRPIRVAQKDKNNLLFAVEELAGKVNSELRKDAVISNIAVRGTKALDPEVVLLRINTRPGDTIDAYSLDRELKRIWDLGYFSDIVLELEQTAQGVNLVFNVIEKPRISKITVENAEAVDTSDIRSAMSTQVGSVLNDKIIANDLKAINELYRKSGYYLATSTYRLEDMPDNTAHLVLTMNEGEKLYIKDVIIKGADKISARKVKGELALTERWLFSFLTGSGVMKEELLERDTSAIHAMYMEKGFIDVNVYPARVEYKKDGIYITHQIDEGARYRVGSVSFAGELIDSDAALLELTETRKLARDNEYFSMQVMRDDVNSLTNFYSNYGYAFAEVDPQLRRRESGEKVLDIVFSVSKQQKVYVRNVIVEGNTQTRDNVILREMRLVDGDMFHGQKLRRSMQRLNGLGYFEVAESELVPTTNPAEVDLKVKLREKSTGSIMGGVGYSTYSKFGVSASIQETNLWGKGYNLGFQVMFSSTRNSYDISFGNPRVYDTKLSLGMNAYRWEDDYTDFDRNTFGFAPRIGYPIGEYSYATLGYRIDFYKLFHFDSDVSQVLRQYEGDRVASVVSATVSRDTTDRMRPADGTSVRLTTEYGGGVLGGDDSFVKLLAEYNIYKTITENTVFHIRLRGGALYENDNDNKPPVFERFWMGGMDSVRGYRSRDIVPRDTTYGNNDRIGGDRMAFANIEYIWNVNPEVGINIVPFFDIGINYDTDQGFKWSEENKKSAGLELRWRSPMGDLRFSWGYPFDDGWGGKSLSPRFEFSVGGFF